MNLLPKIETQYIKEAYMRLGISCMREYWDSEWWISRRNWYWKCHGYICEKCGTNKSHSLQVHHKTYQNLGMEPDDDLQSLCHRCHEKFHIKMTKRVKKNPKKFIPKAVQFRRQRLKTKRFITEYDS